MCRADSERTSLAVDLVNVYDQFVDFYDCNRESGNALYLL